MPNAETRSPTLKPDAVGAERTTPAASMPGTNGGGNLSWYSPLLSSRSGKQTPAARTSMTTLPPSSTTSAISVYTMPVGPDSFCTTQAFITLQLESGFLRLSEVGDLGPARGDILH